MLVGLVLIFDVFFCILEVMLFVAWRDDVSAIDDLSLLIFLPNLDNYIGDYFGQQLDLFA